MEASEWRDMCARVGSRQPFPVDAVGFAGGDLGRYEHVLVVPVCGEPIAGIRRLLESINEDTLTILVVNQNPESRDEYIEANNALMVAIDRTEQLSARKKVVAFHCWLPTAFGVGGARRIGCGIALELIRSGLILNHWLHNTDADCVLPTNYFSRTLKRVHKRTGMVLHGLGHIGSGADLEAACALECGLILGQLWLVRVQTPHALVPSGTGISCSAQAYAEAGGWAPWAYAEDTSMIARLSNVGPVEIAPDVRVRFEARPISRAISPLAKDGEAGHGGEVSRLAKGIAADKKIKTASPAAWHTFAVMVRAIEMWLRGDLAHDVPVVSALILASERCELKGGVDIDVATEIFEVVIGSPSMLFRVPGKRQRKAFWTQILDYTKQAALLNLLSAKMGDRGRILLRDAIDGSPFGVKHGDSWVKTAEALAKVEERHCCVTTGAGSIENDEVAT